MSDQASAKDNEHVEKALKIVLDNVLTQYKIASVDVPNFQFSHLKTYLWLSTFMLAAEVSIFKSFADGSIITHFSCSRPGIVFYATASIALVSALVCFVLGVDAMRGRKDVFMPFGTPLEWISYVEDDGHRPTLPIALLRASLRGLDKAMVSQAARIRPLARKLKTMSWSLLISLSMGIIAPLTLAWT